MMKHETGELHGCRYDVVATAFSDTISVMVYKNNKLGKILKCRLYPQPEPWSYDIVPEAAEPVLSGDNDGSLGETDLELRPEVDPKPLLGCSENDSITQLYAGVIASRIMRESPGEARTVVVGLGNLGMKDALEETRCEFGLVSSLVARARVW